MDRGDPTDGLTTITVVQPPAPCVGAPWTGWNCLQLRSDANLAGNGVSYLLDVRWNRVGLPCRGSFVWMIGGFGTAFHREDAQYAEGVQDNLDTIDQVRTIEVKFLGNGLGAFPQNGFPNLSSMIVDVWEHLLTTGIAEGVLGYVGSSGGSMQGSNALAYHRLKEIVDGAVFGGGPFWTDLEETCLDPDSPFYAPPSIRQSVDLWNYEQINGTTPCHDLTPAPTPSWTCRSTLGIEADTDYSDEFVAVIIGTEDSNNPWMDAAASDYFQTISAATKTFDRPVAPHNIWNSPAGAQTGLLRIREIVDGQGATAARPTAAAPASVESVPNPFSDETRIRFATSRPGPVRLRILDVRGRVVRTLADGTMPPGNYERTWDGTDRRGRRLAAGAYFYRLETAEFRITRKLTLLR